MERKGWVGECMCVRSRLLGQSVADEASEARLRLLAQLRLLDERLFVKAGQDKEGRSGQGDSSSDQGEEDQPHLSE